MFASVIIDNPSSATDYEFEYLVPEFAKAFIGVGSRVKVNFGTSDRLWMGYVVDLHNDALFEGEKKEIIEVLDLEPLINAEQLKLSDFLKKDTICPKSRILNLMIPSSLRLKSSKYLITNDVNLLDANLAMLFKGKHALKITDELKEYTKIINKAIKDGVLAIAYDAKDSMTNPEITKYYLTNEDYHNKAFLVNSDIEKEFLLFLKEKEELTLNEILESYPISSYRVKKLADLGIINKKKVRNVILKHRDVSIDTSELISLTAKFKELLKSDSLETLWIPATFKEELSVILEILKSDEEKAKKTLIIVPDILSSYRYHSMLIKNTDKNIICLNSEMGKTENYEIFEQIQKQNYDIMITTPIGAFYPYDNIGTILIIDEESENYRNDQSPRYDLIEVYKERRKHFNARIIYHSYAPSLKTYSSVLTVLPKLEKNKSSIQVVNLKEELVNGNRSPISKTLNLKIKKALANKEKVLLILNNKGYSQSVLCRTCGSVIKCPHCDTPMQYQKEKNMLVCVTCGSRREYEAKCEMCGSTFIRYIGLGMEKLQEVLLEEFKNVRVKVLKDSKYDELEETLLRLNSDDLDIIISSDVFSRSIINSKITVVGIMALDIVSNAPSYYANERTYSLLKHASLHLEETAKSLIIQTYNPQLSVLKSFIVDDYDNFFMEELRLREIGKVEPIYKVNRLFIKGEYKEMYKTANMIKRELYQTIRFNVQILGPAYNKSEQCVQLIIKHQHKNINNVYLEIYQRYQNSKIMIIFDKYPRTI